MELFEELNDLEEFLIKENIQKLDCSLEKYKDLENRYSSLNETYEKESENSKKVEKCLVKCLKFYSKLRKKYEKQQKIILGLEESLKEKANALEESVKSQEKMKGLLQVYMTERSLYSGESNEVLRRDKEMLLDICCRLISESVKTNNIKSIINLVLRKFKKDLNDDKLNLLKSKELALKKDIGSVKESDFFSKEDLKPGDFLGYGKFSESEKIHWKFHSFLENTSNNYCGVYKKPEKEEGKSELKIIHQSIETEKARENMPNSNINTNNSNKLLDLKRNDSEGIKSRHPKNNRVGFVDENLGTENASDTLDVVFEPSVSEVGVMSCDSDDSESNEGPPSKKTHLSRNYFSEDKVEVSPCRSKSLFSPETEENKNLTIRNEDALFSKKNNILSFEKDVLKSKLTNSCFVTSNVNKSSKYISYTKCKSRVVNGTDDSPALNFNNELRERTLDVDHCPSLPGAASDKVGSPAREAFSCQIMVSTPKPKRLGTFCNDDFNSKVDANLKEQEYTQEKNKNLTSHKTQPEKVVDYLQLSTKDSKLLESTSLNNSINFICEKSQQLLGDEERCQNYRESEDFDLPDNELEEETLFLIFKEMETVRCLSPIKDFNNSKENRKFCKKISCSESSDSNKNLVMTSDENPGVQAPKTFLLPSLAKEKNVFFGEKRKRTTSSVGCPKNNCLNKKLKLHEKREMKGGLLDSIMSAMSVQNEEFKGNKRNKLCGEEFGSSTTTEEIPSAIKQPLLAADVPSTVSVLPEIKMKNDGAKNKNVRRENEKYRKEKPEMLDKVIMEEIKSFISTEISTKKEAEDNVNHSVSVLKNKPEEIIAKSIVAVVLENVDETLEIFERPAPPLTRTQQRLMVLLSVLKTVDPNSEQIPTIVRKMILDKLFPDKFFWPDDCVETATRFYVALCRTENDSRGFWKLCLRAVTEMKQRCCLVVFAALKTWPDVLHDASILQNNLVAVTVVNVLLLSPKSDNQKNFNQKKKLMALKHLLMNFYHFKIEDTMETFAGKIFDLVAKDEGGAEKAFVLLAKARDFNWTCKNILPKLKNALREWCEGKIQEILGNKILTVTKEITEWILQESDEGFAQTKEIIFSLSQVLASDKMLHDTEVRIIEILLKMKRHAEARRAIGEWVPKMPIGERLRSEIINVSAESVFSDLKRRQKKDAAKKGKSKKHKTKIKKGKKKKIKKGKSDGARGNLNEPG